MRFTWRFPGMSFAPSLDAFVLCVLHVCYCECSEESGVGGTVGGTCAIRDLVVRSCHVPWSLLHQASLPSVGYDCVCAL